MKLRRIKSTYKYKCGEKVITYLLHTKYNPLFISSKIKSKELYIQELYYLNQSHTEYNDVYGLVSVSVPIDNLVEVIINEKSKLEYYKKKSKNNLKYLKQVLSNYTSNEQRQLMNFILSNGSYVPNKDLIERLQRDLYKVVNPKKEDKIKKFERSTRIEVAEHFQKLKSQLNTNLEVLSI